MLKRVIVTAGLLVLAGVVPAFAQRVEVGAFVGWSILELIILWAVGVFRREPA